MIDAVRFMYWLDTAELVSDLGKELDDSSLANVPGLIFEDKSYIEIAGGFVEFRTICGREEIGDTNLLTVCQFLWDNHARDNFPEGAR